MKRNDWKFTYTAKVLAEAATAKKTHHEGRLKWWQEKFDEVLAKIPPAGC